MADQKQIVPVCFNCRFWKQYYEFGLNGKLVQALHGLCFCPGRCEVHGYWLSCEKFAQRE